MLDTQFVRAQFPAFSERALEGQAFFENAGGSYACKQVIDRLTRYYRERKVQPYGPYDASRLAGEEMDEARRRLALMLGVATDELSFGPSTTQNSYVLAQAFGQWLTPGDAIIVTNQDHEANSGPWRRLAHQGVEVREWKIDPHTGHLPVEGLARLLDGKVKLVCFPHASNIVAEINPVAEIARLAHDAGAVVCVDGVSYAPHGFPDVGALGADIYLFSAYKTYGPHQGIMVIRRALGERLPNQGHYFNAGTLYKRFTPAGPDHAQIAASAGMADYVDDLYAHHFASRAPAGEGRRAAAVHDLMRARETELLQPLLDFLASKNSVRLLGPTDAARRAPTVAMVLNEPGAAVAARLARRAIMCGGGDFYGVRCLEAQGVDPGHGALRVSFVHYTATDEVEKLIKALDAEI
ncbi:MAG: nitrogen fixation protein NifS [Alphaproteobacteria bacterium RIFCSPHIGHO2_12_FULL_63_12]|nr:MAG: nitrogen fixation protein NifS [Alphaproteobacteria bacterium RIFCSPHIGHO2_12_FULL_63_12]